jgi:hypothetical protein
MVLFNQSRECDQELAPVLWRHFSPRPLKSLACRCYGNIDVFFSGLVNRGNYFFSGRVDDLKRLPINAFNKFIIDEPEQLEPV